MKEYLQIVIFVFIGALSCFVLQSFFSLSSVLSSAIIGLLGSFISTKEERVSLLIYIGSFIGMGADLNIYHLLFSSIISSFLFIIFKNYFNGLGGKLGSLAFLGSLVIYFCRGLV